MQFQRVIIHTKCGSLLFFFSERLEWQLHFHFKVFQKFLFHQLRLDIIMLYLPFRTFFFFFMGYFRTLQEKSIYCMRSIFSRWIVHHCIILYKGVLLVSSTEVNSDFIHLHSRTCPPTILVPVLCIFYNFLTTQLSNKCLVNIYSC